ncbi:MAG: EAL domain-containing protein [Proteobacteria bacterium]|nr:EAL domain-containing protein [Pseudomonadota bacterium]
MSDSPDRGRALLLTRVGTRRAPQVLAVAAVAAVALIAGLTLWNSRANTEREALIYVENHAQIIEDHARQAVREVVQSLSVAAALLGAVDFDEPNQRLDSFVNRIGSSSPRIDRFAIFDSHGQVVAGNGDDMTTEVFGGPQGINPEIGFAIIANRAFVLIDMPFLAPGGASGGILRAGISRRYFEEFYNTINVREGSDVGLAEIGGEVLVQVGALGKLAAPTVQLDAGSQMHAMLISVNGAKRFEAYRRLPDIPIIVFSALDARAVFAPWWSNLRFFAIVFALIAVPLVVLGRLIVQTQRRQRWLASIVASSGEAIWSRNLDGTIASWNKAAERLFGYTAAEIIGQHISVLWRHDQTAELTRMTERINARGTFTYDQDTVRCAKDGREVSVAITASPIVDDGNNIIGAAITARDIREKKEVEKKLHRLAYYDPLVNLPNRVLLEEELAKAVRKSVEAGQALAFHYLDLDHFKDVNDSFGHQVGDLLLQSVARRIGEVVRRDDIVGRLGGDEFGIIQPTATDGEDATQLAERLLAGLGLPFRIDGHEVTTGVSIGTTVLNLHEARELEPIAAARGLLQEADIALYEAKTAGRHHHSFYATRHGDRVQRKMAIQEALVRAVRDDGLHLHFQPQVDLTSKKIFGAEALVRWTDPNLGALSPGEFIPIAEQSSLIVDLGAWVLREACRTAATWPSQELIISVNVSAVQLRRGGLFDLIRDTLNETGLPPHRLELELTESALFRDTEDVTSLLWALRALGVRLAVDDFGTGYSTLSYFKDFPVDKLKIDKSFIDGLAPASRGLNIVRAAAAMAEGLGLELVAEGIETERQRDLLREVGVMRGQGYLFSPAVSSEDFVTLVAGDNIIRLNSASD